MKIKGIFFYSKNGRLLKTAAIEVSLQNFKENLGPGGLGMELHPCSALLALGQIFAIGGNLGDRHIFAWLGPQS